MQLTAAQGRPVAAILSEWQWQVNYSLAIDTAYMWPVEANTHQLNDGVFDQFLTEWHFT